jgi:hypothetical protein
MADDIDSMFTIASSPKSTEIRTDWFERMHLQTKLILLENLDAKRKAFLCVSDVVLVFARFDDSLDHALSVTDVLICITPA